MFSLLLVFLPIASLLANNNNNNTESFLSEREADALLAILESSESRESEENQLIDLSNDTILLPQTTVAYSTSTRAPITPPAGFNGTSFIAFEMPPEELPQCPYCNISRCAGAQLCYIARTGLRGKKSRERCISEKSLASLLVDQLMTNVTHDACQTAKSHHAKAYCWCAPRIKGRVTETDELRKGRIWRYQTLHYYATAGERRSNGVPLSSSSLLLLLLLLTPLLLL